MNKSLISFLLSLMVSTSVVYAKNQPKKTDNSKAATMEMIKQFSAKLDELEKLMHQGELKAIQSNNNNSDATTNGATTQPDGAQYLTQRVERLEHEVFSIKTMLEKQEKLLQNISSSNQPLPTPAIQNQAVSNNSNDIAPLTNNTPGLTPDQKEQILIASGAKRPYNPQMPEVTPPTSNGENVTAANSQPAADTEQTLKTQNPVPSSFANNPPANTPPANTPHLKIHTELAETQYQNAVNSFEKKNYDEAVKELKAFVKDYQTHPLAKDAWFLLGKAYMALDKVLDAQSAFAKAYIENNNGPNAPESLLYIGDLFIKQTYTPKACKIWMKLEKDYPNMPKAVEQGVQQRIKTYGCLSIHNN